MHSIFRYIFNLGGPEFDGYLVDFDEAMQRGSMYHEHEANEREKVCNLFKQN